MASSQPVDIGPGIRGARSAQGSRIPRGSRTQSKANSVIDQAVEESPSGTEIKKNNLGERLQKLSDEIRQETRKKFDDEPGVFQKLQELLKS